MKKHLAWASVVVVSLAFGGSAAAQANNPVGRWSMTFYNDATPGMTTMATQTLCFFAGGTWTGSFPAWGGRWFQKGVNAAGSGDRVRITGNYAAGVGNDSAEIDFNNSNQMTGAWSEWRDGFPFLTWTRVILTRLSTACNAPLSDTQATPADDGTNPFDHSFGTPPTCTTPLPQQPAFVRE